MLKGLKDTADAVANGLLAGAVIVLLLAMVMAALVWLMT